MRGLAAAARATAAVRLVGDAGHAVRFCCRLRCLSAGGWAGSLARDICRDAFRPGVTLWELVRGVCSSWFPSC